MTPEEVPAEPADGTMLLCVDTTPGYEGQVAGVWHRRDSAPFADGEYRWLSSAYDRFPRSCYTWAEAVARGARPDRPLVEASKVYAEARQQVVADAAERVVRKAYAEAAQDRNQGNEPDDLHVAYEIELRRLRGQVATYEAEIVRLRADNEALHRRARFTRHPTVQEQDEIQEAAAVAQAEAGEVDRRVDET